MDTQPIMLDYLWWYCHCAMTKPVPPHGQVNLLVCYDVSCLFVIFLVLFVMVFLVCYAVSLVSLQLRSGCSACSLA